MKKFGNGLLDNDLRGKHGKQKGVDPSIKEGAKHRIESTPKIESYYLNANTSRHVIEGSKLIIDTTFDNSDNNEKENLKEKYDDHPNHLKEKDFSRNDKNTDSINDEPIVAVYDLQAVVQLLKGNVSLFYYKSKILHFRIRSAIKKGAPLHANELCYEDFYDIKAIANDTGPLNMTALKLSETKAVNAVR
ncbi:hypothetical protein PR048_003920 [Dryococelus australis]|uniref:Uncharacterized protein n=1 Tax=Dryococelus australis TaxID=614101 RepID=A0ABQ9IPH2_9NEOP|nr:hypothetical protein PR048_003920 [Dryococelus australis]